MANYDLIEIKATQRILQEIHKSMDWFMNDIELTNDSLCFFINNQYITSFESDLKKISRQNPEEKILFYQSPESENYQSTEENELKAGQYVYEKKWQKLITDCESSEIPKIIKAFTNLFETRIKGQAEKMREIINEGMLQLATGLMNERKEEEKQ